MCLRPRPPQTVPEDSRGHSRAPRRLEATVVALTPTFCCTLPQPPVTANRPPSWPSHAGAHAPAAVAHMQQPARQQACAGGVSAPCRGAACTRSHSPSHSACTAVMSSSKSSNWELSTTPVQAQGVGHSRAGQSRASRRHDKNLSQAEV